MAERYERYERYGYVNIKWEKLLAILLLAIMVAFAAGMFFDHVFADFSTETVSSPSDVGIGTGVGASAIGVANVSVNESEAEVCPGCPEWWHWSKEDWEKFQWYANQTEIRWSEARYEGMGQGIPKGMIYGKIIVAGEPLYKGYVSADSDFPHGLNEAVSPVDYLNGDRKGDCETVPAVYFYLRKIKGENVKFIGARNIDYNPRARGFHYWTEWTDSEGNEWVSDFDTVIPKEHWHQTYNWTVEWAQFDEPPAIFHGQVNRWTTKNGERVTVISG